MAQIHPTSFVEKGAQIDDSVVIGPFCLIGSEAKIGAGTWLQSHISVQGDTTIGCNNRIFQGAAVGCEPQDLKYRGEKTRLVIGDNNLIREHCTLSTGTVQDEGITTVGSGNLFMANVHIAHDCRIGNETILANNVAVAGHVHIADQVIIGGQSGIHQFVHIGRNAMVGGASGVTRDVPPFVMCSGYPCEPHGLNLVGMRRRGFTNDEILMMKNAYKALYKEGNLVNDFARDIAALIEQCTSEKMRPLLEGFRDFVLTSPRGVVR